jgi:hypothetical protein
MECEFSTDDSFEDFFLIVMFTYLFTFKIIMCILRIHSREQGLRRE